MPQTTWKTETELGRAVAARGLSLVELATALGCSLPMARYLVRQLKLPSASMLLRLQEVLGDGPDVAALLMRHVLATWRRQHGGTVAP